VLEIKPDGRRGSFLRRAFLSVKKKRGLAKGDVGHQDALLFAKPLQRFFEGEGDSPSEGGQGGGDGLEGRKR